MSDPRLRRVGLDGFNLAMPQGTGVATYARTLSWALRGMGRSIDVLYGVDVPRRSPPALRESLFFAALGEGQAGGEPPSRITWRGALRRAFLSPWPRTLVDIPVQGRVDARALAGRLPAFDRLFSLPALFYLAARYFRRYGRPMTVRVPDPPAIMHWTYPLPLRLEGARNLYTLHDLVPLRLPFTSLDDRRYYDRLIRACLGAADQVLTVSEASRRDIMALYDVAPERIANTYQAVVPPQAALDLDPPELTRRLQALFGLESGGYFLYFGAIEPKKNLGRLIEAYLTAAPEVPLVIAGPRAWRAEGELRILQGAHGAALAASGRIRQFDYLPPLQLMTLVRGARAVLFPALAEGFGLPALEAMALGAPLLAADTGALPEIVGDAALRVDPYDVRALAEGIARLDQDAELRASLAAAGPRRARAFSLDAYQARLEAVYAEVLGRPAARIRTSPVLSESSFGAVA